LSSRARPLLPTRDLLFAFASADIIAIGSGKDGAGRASARRRCFPGSTIQSSLMMLGLDWNEPGPSLKSLYHRLPDAPLVEVPVLVLEFAAGVRFCWVALNRPLHRVYDEE
jgi:hypothetical protein